MLIGLFTLLYVLVLGTGHESPYIIPKAEKVIVESIKDKNRKNEVKTLNKSFMKQWKALKKKEKEENKKFLKLMKDRNVSADQLIPKFKKSIEAIRSFDQKLGDLRVKVQNIMTDEEWQTAMNAIINQKIKKSKKLNKAEIKDWLKQNKKFIKFADDISASLPDKNKKSECLAALEIFEDETAGLLYENQDQANRVIDIMYSKNAGRDEIASIAKGVEYYKITSGISLITLRSALIASGDDKTWPKLSKSIADFVK
jgi:malate synthase